MRSDNVFEEHLLPAMARESSVFRKYTALYDFRILCLQKEYTLLPEYVPFLWVYLIRFYTCWQTFVKYDCQLRGISQQELHQDSAQEPGLNATIRCKAMGS